MPKKEENNMWNSDKIREILYFCYNTSLTCVAHEIPLVSIKSLITLRAKIMWDIICDLI